MAGYLSEYWKGKMMSETKAKPTAQTVISLILPETDEIPRQGSILAKYESVDGKQSLAHLMPFSYSSLADIARAIEAAQQQLETLKANPPQITVPTPLDATTTSSKSVKAAKPSPQKPKKKKISLDDLPEDDDAEELSVAEDEIDGDDAASLETEESVRVETIQVSNAAVAQNPTTGLKVGDTVEISDGTLDMDGELVPFNTGKVVEIDLSANPPRVWLESSDGEEDVWLPLATLTNSKASANDLSAFEKPIGMGVPNKEGQLTLFG
jgi:hypothetical protein